MTPEAYGALTVAQVRALLEAGDVTADQVAALERDRPAGPRKGVLAAIEERAGPAPPVAGPAPRPNPNPSLRRRRHRRPSPHHPSPHHRTP